MPEGDPPRYITLDAQNTPNSHQLTRSCSHDGQWIDLFRLQQRQDFEQLVARAKPAGKKDGRTCAFQQMQLADGEVMQPEAQVAREIGGWASVREATKCSGRYSARRNRKRRD
jgi:hypothetical protein